MVWISNEWRLEEATEATANFLNKAEKPVIVCGSMLRVAEDKNAVIELIDASGYAFAVMLSSKGLVPELHPNFIGTYWSVISSDYCEDIVEAADAYVVVNPAFNDISSLGYTLLQLPNCLAPLAATSRHNCLDPLVKGHILFVPEATGTWLIMLSPMIQVVTSTTCNRPRLGPPKPSIYLQFGTGTDRGA
ncbi:hypothetical protein Syun_008762 [Stephania yunnanensis]|uniref:Thiamine pyrophosphate enzyme central domain-containing protein n=1 Tax=Stephania yunnanensis TaxID=152371 RepID=A0AAP0KEX6_9MAGN